MKPGRRSKARIGLSRSQALDETVIHVSLAYAMIGCVTWLAQNELATRTPWPLAALTGLFAVNLMLIRRALNDPVIIFVLVMFLYSFIPTIADTASPGSTLGFDLTDAYDVFNAGQIATMFGVAVATLLLRTPSVQPVLPMADSMSCLVGGSIAGILAILLICAVIATRGFVLGGDVSYSESFTQQLEAGNGFYMLCVPLCLGSICLILTSRHPLSPYFLAIPVLCFLLIAVGIGQRKYFIQPALFIFAFYWRPRRIPQVLLVIALAVIGFLFFCYLGFLRINSLGIEAMLSLAEWGNFFSDIGVYVGSETVYLYATAASAVTRFVTPLDNGADYLMAWMYSVPRFLLPSNAAELYTSANDRFSFAYNALEASYGQGYGFSFLGEAFMVGGHTGVVLVVLLQICFFRYLYVRGGGDSPAGLWGALAMASLYYAVWTQRNALAVVFKEFIVYFALLTVAMFYAGRVFSMIVMPTISKIHREKKHADAMASQLAPVPGPGRPLERLGDANPPHPNMLR